MWKLSVFFFVMLYTFVLGGKENFMLHLKQDSWIPDNDLRIMIGLSLPYSTCCNTFVKGHSMWVDNLFHQFINIYRFDRTIQSLTYNCQGYFGIASNADEISERVRNKVPTSISTTELLIIVDDKISKNSSLLNVEMYKNSNVNIVSRSGMWTLSENFLFPRRFKKIARLSELRHKTGIVDLEGRELQVAAFYNPPFCYLSTSENKTVKGIEGQFFIAKDERELDGIETRLFLLMADRLNFTWTIRKPNHYYRYGRPNGSNWEGGMIGQLFRKEVDFAFSGIWLKHDQYRYVNLSEPWYQLSIHFLVPRPKPQTSIWALTRPLSGEVWLALVIMVVLQSFNVYAKAQINPNVPSRFRSFIFTFTELIGRLVGSWVPRKTKGLRLQLHLWHISGLLLVTAYSSSLASRLTTPDYAPRIDTIKQFIEANLTWGREGPVPNYDDYFNLKDPYAAQFPSRFFSEKSERERHRKIQRGNYAIVGRMVQGIFFPENEIRNSDFTEYRVMKAEVGDYYASFAVQPWLVNSVNTLVLWMREGGLTKYHLTDVIHRKASQSLRNLLIEYDVKNDDGARVLALKPLVAGFGFLFFGLMISTIVFFFELKSQNPQQTIIKIIRNMKEAKKKKQLASKIKPISSRKEVLEIIENWKLQALHKNLDSKKTKCVILIPD